jgi:hypothetical protein
LQRSHQKTQLLDRHRRGRHGGEGDRRYGVHTLTHGIDRPQL